MNEPLCWAASLGDCDGKSSREHYVSEAFFSAPVVRVQGLHWCKAEAKTIGLSAATARILCERHNSALSPLDEEAGRYMQIVRDHLRLSEARCQPRFAPFHIQHFTVRARLFERWLLKVLLNVSFGGRLKVGVDGEDVGVPSPSLANICFGRSSFEGKAGMYVGAHNGMSLTMGETLQYSPLVKDDERILGGFFTVAGVYYFLSLDPQGIGVPLNDIQGLEPPWSTTSLSWRFREIKVTMNQRTSHLIRFKW